MPINFGDGTSDQDNTNAIVLGTGTDSTGEEYTVIQRTVQHTYSSAGPWTAVARDCCRMFALQNSPSSSITLQTVIDLRNASEWGSPIASIPIILQFRKGGMQRFTIPISDPDLNEQWTCTFPTRSNSGINSLPSAGGQTMSVSSDCVITWQTNSCEEQDKYAVQVLIESQTHETKVPVEFIIEIVSYPHTPPSCNSSVGTSTVIVEPNTTTSVTFTASFDWYSSVKLSTLGLPMNSTMSPLVGTITRQWMLEVTTVLSYTPSHADVGKVYSGLVTFTDQWHFSTTCTVKIEVRFLCAALNECNGNGRCLVPNYCVCNTGWYGASCNMNQATPPTAGIVYDGPVVGVDIDYQTETNVLKFSWSNFSDPSGITSYQGAVGLSPTTQDVVGYTTLPLSPLQYQFSGLNLINGQTYYVQIRATNNASLTTQASSNGVTIDTTLPTTGTVNDGPIVGKDTDYQSESTISANWNGFSDPESGISFYEWMITVGGTILQPWTAVGTNTTASSTSNLLSGQPDGQEVVVSVRATNRANLVSQVVTSNGFTYDTSPPVASSIVDGPTSDDQVYTTSNSTLSCNWAPFSDPHSGISRYEVAIGTISGGTNTVAYMAVGLSTNFSADGLSLVQGQKYYCSVTGYNSGGLSTTATSNGVTVDSTPPSVGTVRDGSDSNLEIDFQTSTDTVHANWSPFVDSESGIDRLEYCLGKTSGACDVIPSTTLSPSTQNVTYKIVLHVGQRYYSTVRAFNRAGSSSVATSNGFLVDNTVPVINALHDGSNSTVDLHYTSNSTAYCANWDAVDNESHILRVEVSLLRGTSPDGTLVAGPTNVGTANNHCFTGLNLTLGSRYYVSIVVWNKVLLFATANSTGSKFDNTAPVSDGTIVYDPSKYNNDSNDVIKISYSFDDPESGILSYQWKISSISPAADVLSWTSVGLTTSASVLVSQLSIQDGTTIQFSVKATNNARLTTTLTSQQYIFDRTPPVTGTIFDGSSTGVDIDYQSSTTISANWVASTDAHTGVGRYEVAIGTSTSMTQQFLRGYQSVGTSTTASISGLPLKTGSRYYVFVKSFNGNNLTSTVTSNGVVFDDTPPKAGVISDGSSGTDIQYQASATDFAATWTSFTDPESGSTITYEWALGSTAGGQDILPFTYVGTALTASTQRSSQSGRVYATVRATNLAGLTTTASSDGVLIDVTPPVSYPVWDGCGTSDMDYTATENSFSASWTKWVDNESGIQSCSWAIGTTAGGTDVQPLTPVTNTESVICVSATVTLTRNVTYYATVSCTNNVGLTTTLSSNGVKIDATTPLVVGTVRDGLSNDTDVQLSSTRYPISWPGLCVDYESGIASYEVAISSSNNISVTPDIYAFNVVDGHATNTTITSLRLSAGITYYALIRCTNGAGLSVISASNGIRVDDTLLPHLGKVYDGPTNLLDIDYQPNQTSISASWAFNSSFTYTKYEWAVGHVGNEQSVLAFTDVGTATNASATGLFLAHGGLYIVTVRATIDVSFETVVVSSNGVIVDTTAPIAVSPINVGDAQASTSSVTAKWSFTDPESGVSSYEWAIGTTTGGTDIKPFASTGIETSATATSLSLAHGSTYYVTVKSCNFAGLCNTTSSNGFIVDTTPPALGPGGITSPNTEAACSSSTTTITATWAACEDSQSGIIKVEFGLGTSSTLADVYNFQTTSVSATTITISGLSLTPLTRYYALVRCTNKAQLTNITAQPFIAESMPIQFIAPTYTVRHGLAAGSNFLYSSSASSISLNWDEFNVTTATIVRYEVAIGTSQSPSSNITQWTSTALSLQATINGLSLTSGTRYYAFVRAVSSCGLQSTPIASSGWIVDTSPPAGVFVYDGIDNPGEDEQYQINNTALGASWSFTEPQSDISSYSFCAGSSPGTQDVLACVNAGLATSYVATNLNLTVPSKVYITIVATNAAGLSNNMSSNGIDIIPLPQVSEVRDGLLPVDLDFQTSTTELDANWDSVLQASDYIIYAGTTPGAKDIAIPVSTSNSTSFSLGNLALQHGSKYYIGVEAKIYGVSSYNNSDGITVDTTPPRAVGSITHNGTFQSSLTTLYATWDGAFVDLESGIESYSVTLIRTDTQTIIAAATNTSLETSKNWTDLSLVNGKTYHAEVRACNRAKLCATFSSNGVTVDATPPQPGSIRAGTSTTTSAPVLTNPLEFVANWDACAIATAPIVSYSYAIGSTPQGQDVVAFTDTQGNLTSPNLFAALQGAVTDGNQYYLTYRCTTAAGLSATSNSTAFVPYFTAPTAGYVHVRDAVTDAAPIAYQSYVDKLSAIWGNFSTTASWVRYEFAIGSDRWSTPNIVPYSSVGLVRNHTADGIQLIDGRTYYVFIKAVDSADRSVTSVSDGVLVDSTPPLLTNIRHGLNLTLSRGFQSSNVSMSVNFDTPVDAESGIYEIEACISNSSTLVAGAPACDVVSFTTSYNTTSIDNNGTVVTFLTLPAPNLIQGVRYFFAVRATNNANLSTVAVSSGVLVDVTAPIPAEVRDGWSNDIDNQNDATSIQANWDNFVDAESGVSYEFAIGSSPTNHSDDVYPFTSVGFETKAFVSNLMLKFGKRYYACVRATNGAGLSVTQCSDGVYIQRDSSFQPSQVRDGMSRDEDIDYQTSTSFFAANWEFHDTEAPITEYEWAIGTFHLEQSAMIFTSVGLNTAVNVTGLSLVHAERYFVTVLAHQQNGLILKARSNGVVIDSTPPKYGTIRIGSSQTGNTPVVQADVLTASWDDFVDPESGIAFYSYEIVDDQNNVIVPLTSIGQLTAIRIPGISALVASRTQNAHARAHHAQGRSLAATATLTLIIVATNGAGKTTQASVSGIVIDLTPPLIDTANKILRDGSLPGKDIMYQSSASQVFANFDQGLWYDPESGIGGYEIAVGRTPGSTEVLQLVPATDITPATGQSASTVVTFSNLNLQHGSTYYISLRAVNNALMPGPTMTTNGVLIDTTPPLVSQVYDGYSSSIDLDTIADRDITTCTWTPFTDPESSVVKYQVEVVTREGKVVASGTTTSGKVTQYSFGVLAPTLVDFNTRYFCNVTAINGANLASIGSSNGFVFTQADPIKQQSKYFIIGAITAGVLVVLLFAGLLLCSIVVIACFCCRSGPLSRRRKAVDEVELTTANYQKIRVSNNSSPDNLYGIVPGAPKTGNWT